jgi:hypothetical protein
MCAVAADKELGLDRLDLVCSRICLGGSDEIVGVISRQVAPKQAIIYRGLIPMIIFMVLLLLSGCSLGFGQCAQGDGDGIILKVGRFGVVKLEASGQDTTLHHNATMFLDRVKKESLNTTLVQDYLLEATDAGDRVRNSSRATNFARLVRIPETDLEHVIRLSPDSVGEVKRVEDLEGTTLQAVCLAVEDL